MDQHRGLQVSPVEPFPQVCQKDNGKFQTLGFVDAHDLHAAGGRAGGGNRLLPALQQAAEMGYESKQSLVSRALKTFGVFVESNQVLPAPPAARHGAKHPQNIPLVLTERGIPCATQENEDFFSAMEVAVMCSLLEILDNPRQDVPLIAVLRSPLAGFSPDRLALIRG